MKSQKHEILVVPDSISKYLTTGIYYNMSSNGYTKNNGSNCYIFMCMTARQYLCTWKSVLASQCRILVFIHRYTCEIEMYSMTLRQALLCSVFIAFWQICQVLFKLSFYVTCHSNCCSDISTADTYSSELSLTELYTVVPIIFNLEMDVILWNFFLASTGSLVY
jgi:hypothetical protein